jgi:hypothetical protein
LQVNYQRWNPVCVCRETLAEILRHWRHTSAATSTFVQGCQIVLDAIYQNEEKAYQMTTKLPNGHKIFQMAVVYSKFP